MHASLLATTETNTSNSDRLHVKYTLSQKLFFGTECYFQNDEKKIVILSIQKFKSPSTGLEVK